MSWDNSKIQEAALVIFNEGNSCFVFDDHCLVLLNFNGSEWKPSGWLFEEAITELQKLIG